MILTCCFSKLYYKKLRDVIFTKCLNCMFMKTVLMVDYHKWCHYDRVLK